MQTNHDPRSTGPDCRFAGIKENAVLSTFFAGRDPFPLVIIVPVDIRKRLSPGQAGGLEDISEEDTR